MAARRPSILCLHATLAAEASKAEAEMDVGSSMGEPSYLVQILTLVYTKWHKIPLFLLFHPTSFIHSHAYSLSSTGCLTPVVPLLCYASQAEKNRMSEDTQVPRPLRRTKWRTEICKSPSPSPYQHTNSQILPTATTFIHLFLFYCSPNDQIARAATCEGKHL